MTRFRGRGGRRRGRQRGRQGRSEPQIRSLKATWTVKQVGKIEFDEGRILNTMASLIVGEIVLRTGQGIDQYGRPFVPYSASYAKARIEAGRKAHPVTLRLTGGLLGGFGERRRLIDDRGASLFFGPDSGQSRQVRLSKRGVTTTGRAGPSHTRIGEWMQYGTSKTPRRPWLGLTKAQQRKVAKSIEQAIGALKSRRTR